MLPVNYSLFFGAAFAVSSYVLWNAYSTGSSVADPANRLTDIHSTPNNDFAETARKALVVGPGGLYTGSIVGDGPLLKETDDAGRKILEMMSPEQATQKLRKNEESWIVGRGQGVVRYDVVQLPSNDPIEDDHAEKIIEVPQTVAATDDDAPSSDWMFWGVFDGHS